MSTRLRAGFHGSGSPRWLMRAMQIAGLDRAHGFRLELCLLADDDRPHGTLAALAAGEVDVADGDFLAIAQARAEGLPVTAILPYGRILGSLVGRGGGNASVSPPSIGGFAAALSELRGRRLGVLSRGDKNWAILAAACAELAGFDLANAVELRQYASRAALSVALDGGDIDHALVHWHMLPAQLAAGHRLLAEIPALADSLGAPSLPTTFFAVAESRCADASVAGFGAAAAAGIRRLGSDPELWRQLAAEGATPVDCDPQQLRRRWTERIDTSPWRHGAAAALAQLHRQLRPRLPGSPAQLPAGTFCAAFLP